MGRLFKVSYGSVRRAVWSNPKPLSEVRKLALELRSNQRINIKPYPNMRDFVRIIGNAGGVFWPTSFQYGFLRLRTGLTVKKDGI